MKMKVKDYLSQYKNVRNYKGVDADKVKDYPELNNNSKSSEQKKGPGRPRRSE